MTGVRNAAGDLICFDAAVQLMDDRIRDRLHNDLAPCEPQAFYDAYCVAHRAEFGEDFKVN